MSFIKTAIAAWIAGLGVMMAAPSTAVAELLAYEGFDFTGVADGALIIESNPNLKGVTSVGFDDEPWDSYRDVTFRFRTSGLDWNFSGLANPIGGLFENQSEDEQEAQGFTDRREKSSNVRTARGLDVTAAPNSTVWGSYLLQASDVINDTGFSVGVGNGEGFRNPTSPNGLTGGTVNSSMNFGAGPGGYRSQLDNGAAFHLNGDVDVNTRWDAAGRMAADNQIPVASATLIEPDTTYLAVFKAEGVNAPAGSDLTLDYWLFTQEQYETFVSFDGLDGAAVAAATVGAAADQIYQRGSVTETALEGFNTLNDEDYFAIAHISANAENYAVDEIRLGETSRDVFGFVSPAQVIPEPASGSLLFAGVAVLLIRRSRKS